MILQRVNSSIWIAIKETGSEMTWMNSLTDPEERVFISKEASAGAGNCYLLEVSNATVSSNDENGPVNVVRRNCSGEFATDMALCMKRTCIFCFISGLELHVWVAQDIHIILSSYLRLKCRPKRGFGPNNSINFIDLFNVF